MYAIKVDKVSNNEVLYKDVQVTPMFQRFKLHSAVSALFFFFYKATVTNTQ